MKAILKSLLIFLIFVSVVACSDSYTRAENSTDAARSFVNAILQGDHRKAYFYLLKDSTNEMMLETQKSVYNRMTAEEKKNRKGASIHPIEMKKVDDSTNTFRYYQSANPKDTTLLRVVRINGEWLVDLKSVIKL